jgi:hypothetical protein
MLLADVRSGAVISFLQGGPGTRKSDCVMAVALLLLLAVPSATVFWTANGNPTLDKLASDLDGVVRGSLRPEVIRFPAIQQYDRAKAFSVDPTDHEAKGEALERARFVITTTW